MKEQSTQVKSGVSKYLMAIAFVVTAFLIVLQFKVSTDYEPVAEMVGIMDSQAKALNTTYLDYEEQSAILRSSEFLVTENASGYVSTPSKVLYVNPASTVVSSN